MKRTLWLLCYRTVSCEQNVRNHVEEHVPYKEQIKNRG